MIVEGSLLDSWMEVGVIESHNLRVGTKQGKLCAFIEGDPLFVVMSIAKANAVNLSVKTGLLVKVARPFLTQVSICGFCESCYGSCSHCSVVFKVKEGEVSSQLYTTNLLIF